MTDWSVRNGEDVERMSDNSKISTRKKILVAAEEVFSEYGFHKSLVDAIAAKAGLGKGTIYRYFENKEVLFKSLMDENVEALVSIVQSESGKCDGAVEKLKVNIESYIKFFKQHKRLFVILLFEEEGIGCKDHNECWEKRMGHTVLLEECIKEGSELGVFKKLDSGFLSYSILGVIHYNVIKWMRSNDEYDILDELPAIYDFIFNGIKIG